MNSPVRAPFALGFGLLLVSSLPAQQPESDPRPVIDLPGVTDDAVASWLPASVFDAFGLSYLDGTLVGGGPDYEARFLADRVEFTPAMPAAVRTFPLTLRTIGYGRGAANRVPSSGRVEMADRTAYYNRPEFVESYESRRDGIKQSFTFDRLPAGAGDLIVRVQVETDLTLAAERGANGELRFLHENIGGVTIGEVVGIDANGARVTGSMTYDNGSLDLRLPASFVDHAALPLVLDPFVGTTFTVASGFDDSDPDVAYDASNDVYLVTWSRLFSAGSNAIRGQRVSPSGTLVGGFVAIEGSTVNAFGPRVANVATEDAFLVVYSASGNILGRAIAASTGTVSLQAVIRDTADSLGSPDVGGEAVADDEAIVVWDNFTTDEIEAKQVNVNGLVSPPTVSPFSAVVVVGDDAGTSWSNSSPAISKSGGTTGNHCIVWSRQFSTSPNTTVRAVLVNRNLTLLESFISVTQTGDGDSDLPNVDGDGWNWVVAWENEATPASGDNNVQARSIGWDPNAAIGAQGFLHSGIVDVEANVADDERVAQVAWMGDSALIMYEDETSTAGDYDVYAQPVDVFTCADCQPRSFVDGSGGDQGPIRAASQASGGASSDQVLIVWGERDTTTGDNEGFAIRFAAEDGINTNLGGGCSSASEVFANCAVTGNSAFNIRLRGANPSSMAWLVASPDRLDFPSGSCTLVPNPFNGFVISRTTNADGDASVQASIPSGTALLGATLIHQWLIMDTTSPGSTTFGADLSNALQTEIQ